MVRWMEKEREREGEGERLGSCLQTGSTPNARKYLTGSCRKGEKWGKGSKMPSTFLISCVQSITTSIAVKNP